MRRFKGCLKVSASVFTAISVALWALMLCIGDSAIEVVMMVFTITMFCTGTAVFQHKLYKLYQEKEDWIDELECRSSDAVMRKRERKLMKENQSLAHRDKILQWIEAKEILEEVAA